MITEFEEHYNDVDIMKLNINTETTKWKEELEFNTSEIKFYHSLLTSKLVQDSNAVEVKSFMNQLRSIQEDNQFKFRSVFDFKRKLEGMKECDDVQCENHYIQDHLVLKASLEKHFSNYRMIKFFFQKYFIREMKESCSG
ncbi:hypothetical protein [Salinimicrobium sp. GXAS 041]|uniref:hypothetical protein n=1 Tax=Salinimicrobium sp. GXAS 041 TaxID=3400806 RepID=UPI003C731309